jgi:hypothetical protein
VWAILVSALVAAGAAAPPAAPDAASVEKAIAAAAGLDVVHRAACTDLECLAKEIDGAAEKYLKAGTASAHFWDFGKEPTSPRVRIEVYAAKDPAGGAALLDAVSGKSSRTGFGEKGNSGTGPLAWEEFALGGRLVRVSALDKTFAAEKVKAVCTALEKLLAPPVQLQKKKK